MTDWGRIVGDESIRIAIMKENPSELLGFDVHTLKVPRRFWFLKMLEKDERHSSCWFFLYPCCNASILGVFMLFLLLTDIAFVFVAPIIRFTIMKQVIGSRAEDAVVKRVGVQFVVAGDVPFFHFRLHNTMLYQTLVVVQKVSTSGMQDQCLENFRVVLLVPRTLLGHPMSDMYKLDATIR